MGENSATKKKRGMLFALQFVGLVSAPAALVWSAVARWEQAAVLTALVALGAVVPFFAAFEASLPRPRDIVPVAVMSAVAILGRVAFAMLPSLKPASAVVILAGAAFGPQAGFLTGAVTALGSNMFLGQGVWTAWQMYAWGMMGFVAGFLGRVPLFRRPLPMGLYGFCASFFYGWFLNLWTLAGFVRPVTMTTAAATYALSLPMDLTHGLSTLVFLLALQKPLLKKLERIKEKYGLLATVGAPPPTGAIDN